MKRLGKIAACIAAGLALNASLNAASPFHKPLPRPDASPPSAATPPPASFIDTNNPYSVIAARDIFGLVAPAPVDTNALIDASLPKITPEGIMGIFGDLSVLFKVSPSKPGPKTDDEYYTLSEGQRQDNIEVVKIDDKKGIVTFNNNGTKQDLPLADATTGGSTGSSGPGGMNSGAIPGRQAGGGPGSFGGPNGPGGFTRFGANSGGDNGGTPETSPAFGGGQQPAADDTGGGMNFGSAVNTSRNYQPTQDNPPASPEEQIILMEANRMEAQKSGSPQQFLIPPTPLTKFNTSDGSEPQAP
jgi:hypothetical protein